MLKKSNSLLSIIFCGFFLISGTAFAVSEKEVAPPKPQEHKHSDGHHHKQCSQKMSKIDLNKDNKISKEEFIKYHENKFSEMDTNKDGFLDESEMHHMKKGHEHGKCEHKHSDAGDHKHDDSSKEVSK
ncbi:EF hand [Nitrosomonas sp. PY1]|uniref:calcium-binding protein n=1 Tax=Nitrosomonas sp. PY1 TaxID=1803906 RepID=UPI001FC7BC65|nr:calcium-binding protein [Nitrosomonas sp. PY1]GKS70087.1 EF hand [Nitrosomonas sp. PY1]